jgi:hypothetical protein
MRDHALAWWIYEVLSHQAEFAIKFENEILDLNKCLKGWLIPGISQKMS